MNADFLFFVLIDVWVFNRNCQCMDSSSASLIHSVKRGDAGTTKTLLSQGVSPFITDASGRTLLELSLRTCHTETMKLLLSIDGLHFTKEPWRDVFRCSNGKVLSMLLDKKLPNSSVAFLMAAQHSDGLHLLKVCLSKGGIEQSFLNTVLKYAVERGYHYRAVELLLQAGANPYTTYRRWARGLLWPARNERLRAWYIARFYFTENEVSLARQWSFEAGVLQEVKALCPDVFRDLLTFFRVWIPEEKVEVASINW